MLEMFVYETDVVRSVISPRSWERCGWERGRAGAACGDVPRAAAAALPLPWGWGLQRGEGDVAAPGRPRPTHPAGSILQSYLDPASLVICLGIASYFCSIQVCVGPKEIQSCSLDHLVCLFLSFQTKMSCWSSRTS